MWRFGQSLMKNVDRFDVQDWLLVFVVAVVIGCLCLRGFGSRSSY